jgi:hypothetical protein
MKNSAAGRAAAQQGAGLGLKSCRGHQCVVAHPDFEQVAQDEHGIGGRGLQVVLPGGQGGGLAGLQVQVARNRPCASARRKLLGRGTVTARRWLGLQRHGLVDHHGVERHVVVEALARGAHLLDGVHHVLALDHLAEHGVAPALGVGEVWFRKPLSTVLMKNWAVALCGSPVRAMAMVYLSFFRPLAASFSMGRRCPFASCRGEAAALDHEALITRWKMVPS